MTKTEERVLQNIDNFQEVKFIEFIYFPKASKVRVRCLNLFEDVAAPLVPLL